MSFLLASLRNRVDIEVERDSLLTPKANSREGFQVQSGLFGGFAPGNPPEVRIAVGVASGLQPTLQEGVVE